MSRASAASPRSTSRFAGELGYRIKLLGIARQTEAGIEARVHPCMVPATAPIARVDGVFNAVVAEGDFVGRVMLEGRGAGAGPTASAVVADLIDIARGRLHAGVGRRRRGAVRRAVGADDARMSAPYYLRLMVVDRPGVIADVTAVLRDHGVSLEIMLQRGRSARRGGAGGAGDARDAARARCARRWTASPRWTRCWSRRR